MKSQHVDYALTLDAESAVIATAIHDGHDVCPDVAKWLVIPPMDRLREEDPNTGYIAAALSCHVIAKVSRFMVDLNRIRRAAVYRKPEDAWGLTVYRSDTPKRVFDASLAAWDSFYRDMTEFFDAARRRHGRFVVLDIHSYNHRRSGPDKPPADPVANPDVNVGTARMPDRSRWAAIVDRFIEDMGRPDAIGRRLTVGENVKFGGGAFPKWLYERYPDSCCCLSVEFKKTFMDEWTGAVDMAALAASRDLIGRAAANIAAALKTS